MIKKGTAKFCVSFIKVVKHGLIFGGNNAKTSSDVKCCEVCHNKSLLCHIFCKYRSATYQEYLNERFG
jgi:hypothetical protein